MRRITSILLMGFLFITSNAMATTRLVPSTYATIQAAIDSSSDGDTVLVGPGTYTENLYYGADAVVVRSSHGADSTILQAASGNYATVRMINAAGQDVEFSGFTVTGSNYCGIYCVGVSATIKNNIIEGNKSNYMNNGAAIDLNQTYGSMIRGNVMRNDSASTYGAAIHMETCVNDTICYNLIYDCYGYVEIRCLGTDAAIYNNTIDVAGSRCHGISNQLFGTIDCRNNIVVNATSPYYGVYAANGGSAVINYNDLYNNGGGAYGGDSVIVGVGNFSSSPGFWGTPVGEPEEYDLIPPPFSPCPDAGDPDPFFNDFDGSRNDLGWRPWNYDLPVLFVPTQYTTIQEAIDSSQNDETIVVFPGTYVENIDFLGKNIFVCSDSGADLTTIQAANANLPTVRMDSNEPKGAELYGFTITGSNYCGIYCYGSSPTITNNIIEGNKSNYINNGAAIDLNYTSGSFIKGNVMRNDSAYIYGGAIHTEYSTNDTICYNLIYDCYGYIEIRCLDTKAAIYNNTIDVDGSRFGGISNQLSDTINCRNNIIVNVPDVFAGVYAKGIYAANGGYAISAYNCFYNNANGNYGGAGVIYGPGDINADPLFWGMPAGEPEAYDIRPFSPCVDAGDTAIFFMDSDSSRNDMGWKPWYLAGAKLAQGEVEAEIPEEYSLLSNYPNPFNATTTIEFNLKNASAVTLDVYDILGRHVIKLADSYFAAGTHHITWNAGELPSGTYFYKIKTDNFNATEKMLLLK